VITVPGAEKKAGETEPELVVRGHRFLLRGVQIYAFKHPVMVADLANGDAVVHRGAQSVVMVVSGPCAAMIEKVLIEESLRRAGE
jgi:hypothetical protein